VSYTRRMAMGKRKRRARQSLMWVAAQDLPRSAAHPFYRRLNRVLDEAQFDAFVEGACVTFYAPVMGRPSLAPGRYFRLLLLGYFEGLDSERAMAWRAADSLSIRSFLGLELDEPSPDHSTISRTRRLIDVETHRAVFTWILQRLADGGLVKGQTIGIDATTLEANAALRSIVRRDTGEGYQEFLTQLAQASGIETPTREDLARIDRQRPKKGSNAEWTHPHDPDAKITKMKDGRTHLAHKAEHAVDLETGAVVAVTVQGADEGDPATSVETLIEAAEQIETVVPDGDGPSEVVADKGYHSNQVMVDLEALGLRSYIAEPDRGRRNWHNHSEARDAVYRNRRRIRGARGTRLLRQRGERLERPFAHLYRTGRMRRVHLRGHANILKRVLVQAGACNLGLLMRTWFGVGTPRSLQGRTAGVTMLVMLWHLASKPFDALWHLRLPQVEPTYGRPWSLLRPFITSAGSTCASHC
jgi:transposase